MTNKELLRRSLIYYYMFLIVSLLTVSIVMPNEGTLTNLQIFFKIVLHQIILWLILTVNKRNILKLFTNCKSRFERITLYYMCNMFYKVIILIFAYYALHIISNYFTHKIPLYFDFVYVIMCIYELQLTLMKYKYDSLKEGKGIDALSR